MKDLNNLCNSCYYVYNNVTVDIFNYKVNHNINNYFYSLAPGESISQFMSDTAAGASITYTVAQIGPCCRN